MHARKQAAAQSMYSPAGSKTNQQVKARKDLPVAVAIADKMLLAAELLLSHTLLRWDGLLGQNPIKYGQMMSHVYPEGMKRILFNF